MNEAANHPDRSKCKRVALWILPMALWLGLLLWSGGAAWGTWRTWRTNLNSYLPQIQEQMHAIPVAAESLARTATELREQCRLAPYRIAGYVAIFFFLAGGVPLAYRKWVPAHWRGGGVSLFLAVILSAAIFGVMLLLVVGSGIRG